MLQWLLLIENRWQWSGGFALAAKEAYFGLRVRHAADPSRAVNIPVNTTVGPSGTSVSKSWWQLVEKMR